MIKFIEHTYKAQDGLKLYYRTYGNLLSGKLPILCLPGLTRNAIDFHGFATRLGLTHHVICPDYRGRGKSSYDPHPANYQPTTYLNDIRHLLIINGVHRVIVVGTSMGGLLAMGLSVSTPSAVAAVMLNDIGPEFFFRMPSTKVYSQLNRPLSSWQSAPHEFRRMLPNTIFQSKEDFEQAVRATWVEGEDGQLHINWDRNIIKQLRKNESIPDLWHLFRSLKRLPVLALRGEYSEILTKSTFSRMAVEHQKLSLVEVKQTGHAPSLNEPESMKAIDEFLQSL